MEFSPVVQMVPTILKTSKKMKELSKDVKGQMVIVSICLCVVFMVIRAIVMPFSGKLL